MLRLENAPFLSFHSGVAPSEKEKERIRAGIAAIQGNDRAARDAAVEELTAIGVPVVSPVLAALKDTDQHEPRPLYRLFERLMPSQADGLDRTLSLLRLENGKAVRVATPEGSLELRAQDGSKTVIPWSSVRFARSPKEARATDDGRPFFAPLHADRVPGYRCGADHRIEGRHDC